MTIITLWIHLERLQQTVLPNSAYRSQKLWLTKIRSVSCKSRIIMQKKLNFKLLSFCMSHIGSTLNKGLTQHHLNLIKSNKKLTSYSMLKMTLWIQGNNSIHKTDLNRWLAYHKLRIETGRHSLPKSPENLRVVLFFLSLERNSTRIALSSLTSPLLRLSLF